MTFGIVLGRVRDLAASALSLLPGLALSLLVFGAFLLAGRGVRAAVQRATHLRGMSQGVGILPGQIGSWGVSLVGLLVGAAIAFPSISATDLFSVLGVGGVAFRDILQNLLAGILILLTRPFRIGDQIVAGSYEGTVEDMQVRATAIRPYDERRLQVRAGIGYGNDTGSAKQVVLDAVRDMPGILADPVPLVRVAKLGDFAVQLDVLFWIDPPAKPEALDAVDAVLRRIKPALQQAGVDLPYPTTQVLFHDQTEASDGNRTKQRDGWPARGDDPRPRWRVLQEVIQGEDKK